MWHIKRDCYCTLGLEATRWGYLLSDPWVRENTIHSLCVCSPQTVTRMYCQWSDGSIPSHRDVLCLSYTFGRYPLYSSLLATECLPHMFVSFSHFILCHSEVAQFELTSKSISQCESRERRLCWLWTFATTSILLASETRCCRLGSVGYLSM